MPSYSERKAQRRENIRERLDALDASFERPELDITAEDVEALLSQSTTVVVDLFYLAHILKKQLDGWVDETSPNRILVLRRLALHWPESTGTQELTHYLGVTRQCVNQILAKMKTEELVTDCRDPLDDSAKLLWLTKRGLDELRYVRSSLEDAGSRLLRHRRPEQREMLASELRKLRGFACEMFANRIETRPKRRVRPSARRRRKSAAPW